LLIGFSQNVEQRTEPRTERRKRSQIKAQKLAKQYKNTLFTGKSRMPEVAQFKAQGSLLSLTFAPSKNEVKRT
jgi:hypothetical protein